MCNVPWSPSVCEYTRKILTRHRRVYSSSEDRLQTPVELCEKTKHQKQSETHQQEKETLELK